MTQASDSTQAILATLSDNIGKLRDEVGIAISDIKKVDEKVNNLALDVAVVKEKVNGLDTRLDDTNKRIDETNSRINQLEQRFNIQSSWFLGIFGTLVAGLLIFLGRLVFFTAVS